MEDNTPKTEVEKVETTTVTTEPTAQSTTTQTVTTAAATGSSKLPLILAGVGIVAIAAVAAVILIVKPGQNTSSTAAGTGIDAANPTSAVSELNTRLSAAFTTRGSATESINKLTGVNNVDAIEFKLTLAAKETQSNQSIDVVFSGKAASKDGNTGYFEGTGDLKANAQGLSNVSAKLELQVVDSENLYFRLSSFAPAETAAILPLIGLEQNQWYKLPIDAKEATSNPTDAIENFTQIDKEEVAKKPLLVNPKAAADRTVFGKNLKCLVAEVNPELTETTTVIPVEYCGGDTALPIAIALSGAEKDAEFSILIELIDVPSFTLTAPIGAKDASAIFNMLGGAGAGSDSDSTRLMSPDGEYDYSDYTPEELMAL